MHLRTSLPVAVIHPSLASHTLPHFVDALTVRVLDGTLDPDVLLVRDEHDLRARVRVRERMRRLRGERPGFLVQRDDVHFVGVLLHETPDPEAETLVRTNLREGNRDR